MILSSGVASGEEPVDSRFRGGIALVGGSFIAPGVYTLGTVGVQGQVGVQSGALGFYLLPTFETAFGTVGGASIGSAFMVDVMLNDQVSLGAGVEANFLFLAGDAYEDTIAAAGFLAGGRLDFHWYPVVGQRASGRRHALYLGLDLRVLDGGGFSAPDMEGVIGGPSTPSSPSGSRLVVWPQASIGYQTF